MDQRTDEAAEVPIVRAAQGKSRGVVGELGVQRDDLAARHPPRDTCNSIIACDGSAECPDELLLSPSRAVLPVPKPSPQLHPLRTKLKDGLNRLAARDGQFNPKSGLGLRCSNFSRLLRERSAAERPPIPRSGLLGSLFPSFSCPAFFDHLSRAAHR